MTSKVLWALDSEVESQMFERLCVDLLYRNGFKEIVPVEPQDGGRDAEEHPRAGRGREGEAAFFQFSKEKNWKAKLRRDATKLALRRSRFQTFVFVTLSAARGVDRDALAKEIREKYGWTLIIFSRAWLRLQLEEAQPDLARKYLDIDAAPDSAPTMKIGRLDPPNGSGFAEAWRFLEAGKFERAALTIKETMEEHPEPDCNVYTALAWCQYQIHRYDEGLSSINRALTINDSAQARGIRACILVERAIATRDRVSLIEGKKIFARLVADGVTPVWCNLFNLGNAQSALGEHEASIASYQDVLREKPDHVEALKNLGSAFHLVGNHKQEIQCFDRALELDPLKWEALVSKAVSLIVDFSRASEAAELLERALKWHPERAIHWPHVWYWLAEAHRCTGNTTSALMALNRGLAHQPGYRALWRLKSDVLQAVAVTDPERDSEAEAFWQAHLAIVPSDYATRRRLIRLQLRRGDEVSALRGLDEHLKAFGLGTAALPGDSGFSLDECVTALRFTRQYLAFRKAWPVSSYWVEDDPLYDLGFPPPTAGTIQDGLTLLLLVPFGLGFAALEASAGQADVVQRLRAFFDLLRGKMTEAISRTSRELASVVPTAAEARTEAIDRLSEILLFLRLIALREFARQRGWIASQFPISGEDLNLALDGYDEVQIQRNVLAESLLQLHDRLQLFPE